MQTTDTYCIIIIWWK